jgi:hypothetical protein
MRQRLPVPRILEPRARVLLSRSIDTTATAAKRLRRPTATEAFRSRHLAAVRGPVLQPAELVPRHDSRHVHAADCRIRCADHEYVRRREYRTYGTPHRQSGRLLLRSEELSTSHQQMPHQSQHADHDDAD